MFWRRARSGACRPAFAKRRRRRLRRWSSSICCLCWALEGSGSTLATDEPAAGEDEDAEDEDEDEDEEGDEDADEDA